MRDVIWFLSNVGIERLCDALLDGDSWNNGSDIVYFSRNSSDCIDSIELDVYNAAEGTNQEITLSPKEFAEILQEVKNASIEKNPDKNEEYNKLYNLMCKKLGL